MGDLGNTKQSLVAMFDDLLIQQEEAREEVTKPGPEYLLKVMEVSALAKARDSEQWRELQDQKLRLEREVERLQSRELIYQEQSDAQEQQILLLEQEVIDANQRKSEQLTEAGQQIQDLKEALKRSQMESESKAKVIDELKDELRKYEEDVQNHNHGNFYSKSSLEFTKDVSVPSEDHFLATEAKGKFLTSTPAARILPVEKLKKRRSMSLDLQLPRTPIIPGLCQKCSNQSRGSLDSPQLPWCLHGPDLPSMDVSRAAPTMSSALMLQPTRGAIKVMAANRLRKIV